MKMKKVNGSVTHLFELPDNVARQMLAAHPGVYFVDDEEKKEEVAKEVVPLEEKQEEQKETKRPGRKSGKER
jgi:hypothetical protein